MKRRVQSHSSIPGEAPIGAQAELRRCKFHHDPVETPHFELVQTTSSANTIGCEIVSYSNESVYVESLPTRALPGYHVQFFIRFRVDSQMLLQYCLRYLRIIATLATLDDDSLVYLHPVLAARSDSVPGVCVSFAPQRESFTSYTCIIIRSITLAGKPVSAPTLPAWVDVWVNRLPSTDTRLLCAAGVGNAEDAYAALCDGCSTAEEDGVRQSSSLN